MSSESSDDLAQGDPHGDGVLCRAAAPPLQGLQEEQVASVLGFGIVLEPRHVLSLAIQQKHLKVISFR